MILRSKYLRNPYRRKNNTRNRLSVVVGRLAQNQDSTNEFSRRNNDLRIRDHRGRFIVGYENIGLEINFPVYLKAVSKSRLCEVNICEFTILENDSSSLRR